MRCRNAQEQDSRSTLRHNNADNNNADNAENADSRSYVLKVDRQNHSWRPGFLHITISAFHFLVTA